MNKTPKVSVRQGQQSAPGGYSSNYLLRNLPASYSLPGILNAQQWRDFVVNQPILELCRDTISSHLLSLDWKIEARDSEMYDELKAEIEYYTKLVERGNAYYSELDYSNHIEWIVRDLFDLPFGCASEIGREYGKPDGKVIWIRPLDAGTLYPTLNLENPVVQIVPHDPQPVVFSKDIVSRVFLSPRTEISREGWGIAPPEKIYLAAQMISKGDQYYYNLLLNTPEAGILDLKDMDKESATDWVNSFRDLLFGVNALKIPVLYEHTEPAEWIPFGKLPNDIMYDRITNRYITLVTAGYGLSPSDIGFASSSNGGETLAGTIRQERRSDRSGKSLAKIKVQLYWNKILPSYLKFAWIDYDDEKNVSQARARLATATALKTLIDIQALSPDEGRRQLIADGLISITIPETIDRTTIEWPTNALRYIGNKSSNPETKQVPSNGGQGDVIPQQIIKRSESPIIVSLSKIAYQTNSELGALLSSVRLNESDRVQWEALIDGYILRNEAIDEITESALVGMYNRIVDYLDASSWVDSVSSAIAQKVINNLETVEKAKTTSYLTKKAEQDFISGITDELELPDESLNVEVNKSQITIDVKAEIITNVTKNLLVIAKNTIKDYKYEIDTKDTKDSNNIELAKSVASKVYNMLPKIININ